MLRGLTLKFGRAPGQVPLSVPVDAVTVFVGPNNSGKSLALREIHRLCIEGTPNAISKIVSGLDFSDFEVNAVDRVIDSYTLLPKTTETVREGFIIVGHRNDRLQLNRDKLKETLASPNDNKTRFSQYYLKFFTKVLDGSSRIGLVSDQPGGDLQGVVINSLQALFLDDATREEVRNLVFEAFGTYFVIDPTNLGNLRIRLSPRPPENSLEERGVHQQAVEFHGRALPISEASDGVKAFIGMLLEVRSGSPEVVIIDEPEAFLHPSLAFTLGKELSKNSLSKKKKLIVATHSADFIMGCIHSGAPLNIVRLTFRNGMSTARLLQHEKLNKLMRNPLLRSVNAISGLFYEFVVVAEADADRAFYQEVNERLLRSRPQSGLPNALFLNAQNKQTVHTIISPLRELGIPAAAVVDIDILKEGGANWTNFLSGGYVPEIDRQAFAATRAQLVQRLGERIHELKRAGIQSFELEYQESANNLFDRLEEYGLFTVRVGEVERWLRHLSIPGHGPEWLVSMFERMGDDPEAEGYVAPGEADVWEFLGRVRRWLVNPARKGIPL